MNEKIQKLKTFKKIAFILMLFFLLAMLTLKNFELDELANIPYVLVAVSGISVILLNLKIKRELMK